MNSPWSLPGDLYSAESVRGTYNPLQLVVRLDSDLHSALNAHETGFYRSGDVNPRVALAFSTYFHETIHWWQHVGSTTGLLLSLTLPAESHVNRTHLLGVLREMGGIKSLRKLVLERPELILHAAQESLNTALNNCHDIVFNRLIMLESTRLDQIIRDPFFDSIGHSIEVGLSNALWTLLSTFDHKAEFLPDIKRWESQFEDLRTNKVDGFYCGSPIYRLPISGVQILEGQARFCQFQYLYLSSSGRKSWEDFDRLGMMGEVYISGFRLFLKWTGWTWPKTPIDPIVHLFLLVCDLSINPSDGYPFDFYHFESVIESLDPSWRFFLFSQRIAIQPNLCSVLSSLGKEAYLTISEDLCSSVGCRTPVENSLEIIRWSRESAQIRELMGEEEAYKFKNENLPVRLYFAKHIRFAEDRINSPDFFCWPAMHLVSHPSFQFDHVESLRIWEKHSPLFVADLGGEIRPVLAAGRLEEDVYHTFNRFYMWNILYDIIHQWVFCGGPFSYDYKNLTPKYSEEEMKHWVTSAFRQTFEFSIDDFDVLG